MSNNPRVPRGCVTPPGEPRRRLGSSLRTVLRLLAAVSCMACDSLAGCQFLPFSTAKCGCSARCCAHVVPAVYLRCKTMCVPVVYLPSGMAHWQCMRYACQYQPVVLEVAGVIMHCAARCVYVCLSHIRFTV
jgi:hypothetical protein